MTAPDTTPTSEIADWEKILLLEQSRDAARADLAAARTERDEVAESYNDLTNSYETTCIDLAVAREQLAHVRAVADSWVGTEHHNYADVLYDALAAVPDSTNAPAGEPDPWPGFATRCPDCAVPVPDMDAHRPVCTMPAGGEVW